LYGVGKVLLTDPIDEFWPNAVTSDHRPSPSVWWRRWKRGWC